MLPSPAIQLVCIFWTAVTCAFLNPDATTEEKNTEIFREISDYLEEQTKTRNHIPGYALLLHEVREYQRIPVRDDFKRYEQLNRLLDKVTGDTGVGLRDSATMREMQKGVEAVKRSLFIEVPHQLNFIWIGGIGETQLNYLKVWKEVHADTDYEIRIWKDSGAYLANFLRQRVNEGAEKYIKESGPAPCKATQEVFTTIGMQDIVNDILAKQMKKGHSYDQSAKIAMLERDFAVEEQIDNVLRDYEASWDSIKDLGIEVREISELWNSNDKMRSYYYQELGLRQFPAAAADIIRARILKLFGGIYSDVDLLPPLNKEKIATLVKNNREKLFSANLREELKRGDRKATADVGENIRRFITKKLMDHRLPPPEDAENFVAERILDTKSNVNWRLLNKLIDDEKGSIVDWSKPLSDVRVPPGSEAAFAKIRDGFGNCFLAASHEKGRNNPGMKKLESLMRKRYEEIERNFVRLPHGVWPGWPIVDKPVFLESPEAYRLDSIVPKAVGTISITGPSAVKEALGLYQPRTKLDKVLRRNFNRRNYNEEDHMLGYDYFNFFTDEEYNSWVKQADSEKNFYTESSERFNFVLRIGNDKAVKFASNAAYAKSLTKGRGVHLAWDKKAKTFNHLHVPLDDKMPKIENEKVIKLAVVGHGDEKGGVVGIKPEVLARELTKLVRTSMSPEVSGHRLGKVSFIGCQLEAPVLEGPLPEGFVKTFLDTVDEGLDPKNTVVTMRNSDVQTNAWGKKLYAIPKLLAGLLDRMRRLRYDWVRGPIDEENPILKSEVRWNQEENTWWTAPKSIDHGNFVKLDFALDRSGPLHGSVGGMNVEMSKMISLPHKEEYRNFQTDNTILNIPDDGVIVTEPGLSAIFNSLRKSNHEIVVVGSSPKRLEGTRGVLSVLSQSNTIGEGLKAIQKMFPSFASLAENFFKQARDNRADFELSALTKRIKAKSIKFAPMDMTDSASANYMANLVGSTEKETVFFFSDQPNADNKSPSTFHRPEVIQRRALMNTFIESIKNIGGTLRLRGTENANRIISSLRDLANYEALMHRLTSGKHLFKALKAQKLVQQLDASIETLRNRNKASSDSVIVLESLEWQPNSNDRCSFNLISHENPDILTKVETDDTAFSKVKSLFDSEIHTSEKISESPELYSGLEAEPVTTMSTGMFVLALSHIVQGIEASKQRNATALSKTIEVQMWMNFVGATVNWGGDVGRLVEMAQSGLRETAVVPIEETASALRSSFRALSAIDRVASPVLAVANVIADIFELAQAHTNAQKAIIGTQTAFDLGNIALIIGSIKLGATTLGLFVGHISAIFAGLAIGVRALADSYLEVAAEAAHVGKYVGLLDAGFQKAYHLKNGQYVPNAVTVIKEINFKRGIVRVGSPMLSKSIHWYGSGKSNYIRIYMPKRDTNPQNVFSIQERLGRPEIQYEDFGYHSSKGSIIVMPIAPNSTVTYDWNLLPFALSRHDYGFSILRKLEECGDFDYDFYLVPGEYIITKMGHNYHPTSVRIVMDHRDRILVTPKPPHGTLYRMTYEIIASSGSTTITLQNGVQYVLSADRSAQSISITLDASMAKLSSPLFQVYDSLKQLWFYGNGMEIDVTYKGLISSETSLFIHTATDTYVFDVKTSKYTMQSMNGSPLSKDSLHEHLLQMVKDHHTGRRFVKIENAKDFLSSEVIDYGFYDTNNDKIVYNFQRTNQFAPMDIELMGKNGAMIWFMSGNLGRIWAANSTNHEVLFEAQLFDPEENIFLRVSTFHVLENTASVEILLQIEEEKAVRGQYLVGKDGAFLRSMEISTAAAHEWSIENRAVQTKIRQFWQISRKNEFISVGYSHFHFLTASRFTEYTIMASAPSVQQNKTLIDRFWIFNKTGQIIRPRFDDSNEIQRVRFLPGTSADTSPMKNLLVHFDSTGSVWQYIPKDKLSGELSKVQENVSHVALSGIDYLLITHDGSIVQIMPNRKRQVVGFTTNALNPSRWTDEIRKSIESQKVIKFYKFADTHLLVAGIWYFPRLKSFALVASDTQRYAIVDAYKDISKALLIHSNGTLWTIPLVKQINIAFSSDNIRRISNQSFDKPQLWNQWNTDESILSVRHLQGEAILETQSGLTFSIIKWRSNFSFLLKSFLF